MAIAFQSTSISAASAAAAGVAAQSAIRDALVAHASGAWTLVEEFDSAGSTVHWVVLKNSAAISGNGVDFYLVIGRMASTGQLCMMLGEVYTSATDTLSVLVPLANNNGSGGTSQTILADFSYAAGAAATPASFALGTTFPSSSPGPLAPVNTAAATMRFVTMIEKEYAIIHLNTTAWYIGALTDLIVPATGLVAATPIGLCDLFNLGIASFGALTRHPIDAALAPMQAAYTHSLQPLNNNMALIQRQAVDTAIYLHPDRFQGNRVAASELAAIMQGGAAGTGVNNTPAKLGALRGKFKGLRLATYPSAVALYDTIVVDGRKHIVLNDRGLIQSSSEFVLPVGANTATRYGFACDTGVAA